jgi:hypothetical protein
MSAYGAPYTCGLDRLPWRQSLVIFETGEVCCPEDVFGEQLPRDSGFYPIETFVGVETWKI